MAAGHQSSFLVVRALVTQQETFGTTLIKAGCLFMHLVALFLSLIGIRPMLRASFSRALRLLRAPEPTHLPAMDRLSSTNWWDPSSSTTRLPQVGTNLVLVVPSLTQLLHLLHRFLAKVGMTTQPTFSRSGMVPRGSTLTLDDSLLLLAKLTGTYS